MAQDILEHASSLLHHHHLSRQIGHLKGRIDQLDKSIQVSKTRPATTDATTTKQIQKLREEIEEAIDRELDFKAHVKGLEQNLDSLDGSVKEFSRHCVVTQLRVEQLEQEHKKTMQGNDQKRDDHARTIEQAVAALMGKLDDLRAERLVDHRVIGCIQDRLAQLNEDNLELRAAVKELSSKPLTQDAQVQCFSPIETLRVSTPQLLFTQASIIHETPLQLPESAAVDEVPSDVLPQPRKRASTSQSKRTSKRRRVTSKRPRPPQNQEQIASFPSVHEPIEDQSAPQVEVQATPTQHPPPVLNETLSLRGRQVAKPYLASQQPRGRQKVAAAERANKAATKTSQAENTQFPHSSTPDKPYTASQKAGATTHEAPTKNIRPKKHDGAGNPAVETTTSNGFKFNIIRRSNRVYGRTRHQAPVIFAPTHIDSSSETESNLSAGEL